MKNLKGGVTLEGRRTADKSRCEVSPAESHGLARHASCRDNHDDDEDSCGLSNVYVKSSSCRHIKEQRRFLAQESGGEHCFGWTEG